MWSNHTWSLVVIWNDTTDKVWICVAKGGHQFGKLFFIECTNSSEHTSTLGSNTTTKWCIITTGHGANWNDLGISPEIWNKLIWWFLEKCTNIFIQWIHILGQPWISFIFDLAGIVSDDKIGFSFEGLLITSPRNKVMGILKIGPRISDDGCA